MNQLPLPLKTSVTEVSMIQLTEGQQRALEMVKRAVARPEPTVSVIAGYAGVGKTFSIRVIAEQIGRPAVITPTGKAALRVHEATGLSAQTIHRWIYKPIEDRDTGLTTFIRRELDEIEIPDSRLVLLDEASMVGPDVWQDVSSLCQQLDITLVLIGDPFQLMPVQPPGAPSFSVMTPEFADAIGAERVELTQILRQAEGSPIIRASMRLRQGERIWALNEIQQLGVEEFWPAVTSTYRRDGVVICHRNVTRHQVNAGIRMNLGIADELPHPGEPLLVLKNNYDVGFFNGETTRFIEWTRPPGDDTRSRIYDRYKRIHENLRYGCAKIGGSMATVAVEEIHGRLSSGPTTIARAAKKWALASGAFLGGKTAPHIHVNFGYCFTAHKSQGSQWPYALIVLESSIRLDEEDGRRWMYTALTRAEQAAAIYTGGV